MPPRRLLASDRSADRSASRATGAVRAAARHTGILAAAMAALVVLPVAPLAGQPTERFDLVIRGGTVIDGTGAAPRRADVAIRGDRIVRVGTIPSGASAARTINAAGLVVAPGFIDPHTHAYDDLFQPERLANQAFLLQGVTTVVTGNDGYGPIDHHAVRAAFTQGGVGTNVALYVGHGTVRRTVMGARDVAPDAAQLARMEQLVDSAMRAGALGLSTGLYYAPGSYATTDEVIALARVAARHGGIYDTHQRDESSYTIGLLASTDEVIRIGREAGLPVHIAHLKALGADVWGRSDSLIARIARARAEGVRITADQYPYTASGSSLGASLLPRWAEAGGRDSLRQRLDDPSDRARIAAAMRDNLRRRGGADALRFVATPDTALRARTLAQVATARGQDPVDAAIAILRTTDVSVASFNMQEPDIVALMRQPWLVTGSDGSGGHPRKFGTFPRKLQRYVRGQGVLSLERFIEASSAQTAGILQLAERGQLREGWFADVIAFDPATFREAATYDEPERPATGMALVVVNGQVAARDGQATDVRAGRVLSRATFTGASEGAPPAAALPRDGATAAARPTPAATPMALPPHALPPGAVPHGEWAASPPLGHAADAARRNAPAGGALSFRDLTITVLGAERDTVPGGRAVDVARLALATGTHREERTVREGAAFNWHGYHVAVVAVYGPGELGAGLVALEVATVASLPAAVARSDSAGGAALRLRIPHRITHVTLHHTGSPEPLRPDESPAAKLRGLQSWGAADRNWWDVPYHFLLDLRGTVYEGRDWRFMGETNTTYDPGGHFLISVIGNYDRQEPTPEQLGAIADLMAWAVQRFDVPLERIGGHGDYADTGCPGRHLRRYLDDGTFRRMVAERL